MFGNRDQEGPDGQFKLLEELELNQPKEVLKTKDVADHEIRSSICVDPGSISQRSEKGVIGTTSKVSKSTLTATFNKPLLVGDVYMIAFTRSELDITNTYVQCRKCRLITEDTFEVVFSFFDPIDI